MFLMQDFDVKLTGLDKKITSNKTKYLLVENEFKKLKTFDLSYFNGKSHFEEDVAQDYLIFQPLYKYFKVITGTDHIPSLKSKGLSVESIKPLTASYNNLAPALSYYDNKIKVKFTGSCLKQTTHYYHHKNVVNIYIVYELGASGSNDSDPTLKNCLFGEITLTKNADIDKYVYSRFGIGFDRRSSFWFPGVGCINFWSRFVFGVDMSCFTHIDNKKKDILVLEIGPTQALEHALTAEKIYSINFTVTKKKILFEFALQWSK